MSNNHTGNIQNQITYEEHDGPNNAKRVTVVSGGGQATVAVNSLVTLGASPNFIGLVTVVGATGNTGNVTLNPGPNFIGIVTVANPGATGNVTLDAGSKTQIVGNVTLDVGSLVGVRGNITLSDPKTYIGLTTATNASAWPDPKTYIGLVTVGHTIVSNIIGNLTLSDPKGFIGLVTIVGSLSPAAGNITLDAGSRTGIVGNVTLTDAKTYIGLVTSTIGNNPVLGAGVNSVGFATVANGLAWPDPKTYIGLVTITGALSPAAGNITLDAGSKTQIVGNLTLSDSKGFIGLTTTTLGASPAFIGIATTINAASPAFIGIVTAINAASPAFIGIVTITNKDRTITGNITLDVGSLVGIRGNLTLTDSKAFIGLSTVVASVKDTFASLATFTMSLASLATSTTGVGRQSTLIDNSTNNYTSANVYLKIFTGGLAHTPNSSIFIYLLRRDNNSVGDDGAGASDAALTVVNAPLLGVMAVSTSNISTAYQASFDTSPLGPLGPQWGIAVVNQSGAALGGTESNHLKNWIGVNTRLT